jgi:hypothetical protein
MRDETVNETHNPCSHNPVDSMTKHIEHQVLRYHENKTEKGMMSKGDI